MFRRARQAMILVLSLTMLAACGGDSVPPDDLALVEAMQAEIASAAVGPGDPETHRCYAEGAVRALGGAAEIERRFGVTPPDVEAGAQLQTFGLNRADAVAVADALLECVDEARLLSTDSGITYRQAECLLDEVDQGLGLNLSVAAGLIGTGAEALIDEYEAHLDGIGDDLLAARSVCFN